MPEFKELTLDELAEVLSLTIKHDYENKIVTFLAMLSAYTDHSQINISFNAPSSAGKTYLAREIADFFPEEDRIALSGASPTSFFYGEAEEDEERNARLVNLERKILIFYEQPNPLLQAKLRSVLSHDDREMIYRMTNKGKKGENRAELIIIRGFPSTVFCSAGQRLDEQEATRAVLLSPEVTEEKLREGVNLQAMRNANTSAFLGEIETNEPRAQLKRRIVAIRDEMVDDIIILKPNVIKKRFEAMVGPVKPRHMRDMGHLMNLIKAATLLNVWHRRQGDDIVASQSDIDQAFDLWSYFMESLQLGVSPALLNFYKDFILMVYLEKKSGMGEDEFDMLHGVEPMGISRQELSRYYLSITSKPLQDDYLRKEILPQLENCGLIQQAKPTTGDRRSMHIYPQVFFEDEVNNIGEVGGTTPEEKQEILDTANKLFPT
jgi:hypothetical protein